jgi:four helix bundle protein
MAKIQSYKELIIWQEAMNLAEMVYTETRKYPKEEMYGLTSQTRRAAVSIPANIAEGYGRANRKEYLHFLSIASGSLAELETHLLLAARIKFINGQEMEVFQNQLNSVGRLLNALRKSLATPQTPNPKP